MRRSSGNSSGNTRAVLPVAIIAGGKGTRIAAIAGDLPKALIPVDGVPFIDHQLRWLARSGARDVVLLVGYRADAIETFVGNGSRYGLHVRYSDDGAAPRGTGGAVAAALQHLGDAFVTVYGDALLQCDPAEVVAALQPHDAGVMSVFENRDRWLPSNVKVQEDRVIAYDKNAEPGTMTHIDYGINVFRARAFEAFAGEAAFDLASVHRSAIERRELRAFPCGERWFEIGSPEGLAETENFLRDERPA